MALSETELERMIVRLVGDGSSYTKMMEQAQTSAKQAASQIQESSKKIESISASIGTFAASATTALGGIVGSTVGLNAFTQFDQAMIQSTSIMKLTEEQARRMRDAALDLASKGGRGAEIFAQSYGSLAMAGFRAEQGIAALPVVSRFATVAALDMASAATLLGDTQSALGLRLQDTAKNLENLIRLTDIFTAASTISSASASQFANALAGGAGSALRTFNKTAEEGVAVLAAMANQGIKSGEAGSSLAHIMRVLAESAVSHADAHKRLGFEVFDATGKMRNMADILQSLEQVLGGMDDKTRSTALDLLGFNARIQGVLLPLIGTSKAIRDYESALKNSSGATQEIANILKTSFLAQINALKNQVNLVAIDIGTMLSPALAYVANILRSSISWWRSMSDSVKQATVAVALLLATMVGIGPVMALLSPIGSLITSSLSPLFTLLPHLGMLLINPFRLAMFWINPVFVLFRNLVSVAAAVIVAIQRTGGIEEAWRKVEESFIAVYEWLTPIGEALSSLGSTIVQTVIRAFIGMGEVMLNTLTAIVSYFNVDWKQIQTIVVGTINMIELTIANLGTVAVNAGILLGRMLRPFISSAGEAADNTDNFSVLLGKLTRHLIVVTGVLVTGIVAWKLTSAAVALATTVFILLHLQQIIGIGIWIASTVAVGAFKVVVAIASAVMSIFGGIALFTGSTLIGLAASLYLVASALTIGVIIGFFAAGGAIVVFGTALAFILSPLIGTYLALVELTKAIQSIPTNTGPIEHFMGLFKEWNGLIAMVVDAMKVDMTLAWKIFEASVTLGIAQIKSAFPPLWQFIKDGFVVAGTLVKTTIGAVFDYISFRTEISAQQWLRLITKDEADKWTQGIGESFDAMVNLATKDAAKGFQEAASKFKVVDSEEVTKARTVIKGLGVELEKLKEKKYWEGVYADFDEMIAILEADVPKTAEQIAKDATDAFNKNQINLPPKGTQQAIEKLEASLWGSAEAMNRLQTYTDLFYLNQTKATSITMGIKEAIAEHQKLVEPTKFSESLYKGKAIEANTQSLEDQLEGLRNAANSVWDQFNTTGDESFLHYLQEIQDKVKETEKEIAGRRGNGKGTSLTDWFSNYLDNTVDVTDMADSIESLNFSGAIYQAQQFSDSLIPARDVLTDIQDIASAIGVEVRSMFSGKTLEQITEEGFVKPPTTTKGVEIQEYHAEKSYIQGDTVQSTLWQQVVGLLQQIASNTTSIAEEESLSDLFDAAGL